MANKPINLANIPEEELLNSRICDLPLSIKGTWLEECINELYTDLESKDIFFKPECYLADEWLTPDKEPVIGIPFFLAHPALIKLEKKMFIDAEGSTRQWCMMLLRHETGHAINYAYKFYRRKKWQEIFGQFTKKYEDTYRFRPYSRSFVRHLEDYYAQYHPDEDFAETFAVWLTRGLDWKTQYKGWKAMAKLNYVDGLMGEIKKKKPVVKKGEKYWQASRMRLTLKNFYKRKQHYYAENFPDFHDSNLKKIFILFEDANVKLNSNTPGLGAAGNSKTAGQEKEACKNPGISVKSIQKALKGQDMLLAADVIVKYKKSIINNTAKWTGEKKYIINDLLSTIIERCKALHLVSCDSESIVMLKVSIYITALVMNYLYTGRFGK